MDKFKLPIAMLAVGGVAFILFGDSFLVIMLQTTLLFGALLWEHFHPPKPPHDGFGWPRGEP
jgi:hypothetical protein